MPLDDNKRQHDLHIWLTDREFMDLCKQANLHDRKPGEMGRVYVRRSMYGSVGQTESFCNETDLEKKGRDI